jgi:ferric-dicitrate binding protein FerR (iron transport regulator)
VNSQELDNYNKKRFEGMKSSDPMMDWIFDVTEVDIPESNTDVAWNKIQAKIAPVQKKHTKHLIWKVAAAISLLAIVSYIFIGYLDTPNQIQLASMDEAIDINLPDGSSVTLNAQSAFSYPETFGETRTVTLEGEAFFDIKKSDVPFIIEINDINVRVLGTAFNVNTHGDEVIVVVERGLVAMEKNDKQVKIAKGQQGVFNKKTYEILVDTAPNVNVSSWKSGAFVFDETPLEDALYDLGKFYNVSFKINNQLKGCRVTASFDNAPLEEVLKVFETILSASITQENSQVRLKGKGCQ